MAALQTSDKCMLIPPLAGLRFLDRPALDAYINLFKLDM